MAGHPDVEALQEQIASDARITPLLETVGERLGASLSARAVFGAPVKRGEVTVIPVARATLGFGAGGGSSPGQTEPSTGGGGGGGGMAIPIGYIEVTDHGASYHRIDDPVRRAAAGALTALATAALIFARSRR